jgi:hypothetical protein
MNPVVGIGFAAFFVAALTVGVRLLLLWRRTRELPELLIGLGVLGIGPVGFGLVVIANGILKTSPTASYAVMGLALLSVAAGSVAKLIFNWRVYHPGSPGVRTLVFLATAMMACGWLADAVTGGFSDVYALTPQYYVRSSLQIGALLWGSCEAFVYWLKMRRRRKLGLADPVVTNRFLLWGIGAFAAGFGTAIGSVYQAITGQSTLEVPWLMMSSSMHGLVAAIAMWLAFVPPARYVRWIESSAVPAE